MTFEERRRNRDFLRRPYPRTSRDGWGGWRIGLGNRWRSSPAAVCCRRSGPGTGAAGNLPPPTNCGP